MKVINLIDQQHGNVLYTIGTFPDGEPFFKFTEDIDRKETYNVICRVSNPTELFRLLQVGNILNNNQVEFSIDIFYLMSMRMDRIITFNEPFSLKLVADMINTLNAQSVRIFHPHSDKALKLINNAVDMEEYYDNVVFPPLSVSFDTFDNLAGICFPDAGAYKRYCEDNFASVWEQGLIVLKKKRNLNTGEIEGIEIDTERSKNLENVDPQTTSTFIVFDDLCDAGGTFLGAHKVIKEKYPNTKIDIFIRHAVNKVGINRLASVYDHVYITDSYADWNPDRLPQNVFVVNLYNNFYDGK
jgi:ribose-phosphate pyrophosphokinase